MEAHVERHAGHEPLISDRSPPSPATNNPKCTAAEVRKDRTPLARRVRWIAIALSLLLLFLFVGMSHRSLRFMGPGGFVMNLDGGALLVGVNRVDNPSFEDVGPPDPDESPWRFDVQPSWSPPAAAWRPFRTAGAEWNQMVFPLWQPLLLCIAAACFAQGYLLGRRQAEAGHRCWNCGYSLRGLRIEDNVRVCPECGGENALSGTSA